MSEEMKNTSGEYSADSIQVLEGLEAVRKRPAMYIGDISEKGLHHLVYEVVDNSIDEALAGFCSQIDVVINEDNSITVTDDGRGIPVGIHEKEGKSALEVVLTVLHAGGKFDKGTYKVSGGLHGVGVSCVNALSTYLKAEVRREGKIHMQEFSCGKPLHGVEVVGTADTTGTTISFKPDGSIFTVTEYKYEILATRLRELAFLNAGVSLTLTDKRVIKEDGSFKSELFRSEEGLKEFVRYVDRSKESLIPDVIHIVTEKQGIPVEVAMTYNTSFNESVFSYVNDINTIEGGTHLEGFKRGITKVFNDYARSHNIIKEKEANLVMNTSFSMLCVSAILLMAVGLIFARPLLKLFGTSESAMVYALPYLMIYLLGTLPSMLAVGLNPFINAQGYSIIGMFSVTIGAAANLLLDPLFIFVFGFGVRGAAIATVISGFGV